jgi:phospholipid/cholesterol/gamma-HCH transport system substrate-binding protein
MSLASTMGGVTRVLSLAVVVAVMAALALAALPDEDRKYVTASFPRTVSLYEGSDVRILGVPVGKVEGLASLEREISRLCTSLA